MKIKNINEIDKLPIGENEFFDTLCKSANVHVERIISNGQTTPPGKWFDSDKNEWVLLVQGKATLQMENNTLIHLKAGDYLLIPAHQKHRVSYTSAKPHCIWITLYF